MFNPPPLHDTPEPDERGSDSVGSVGHFIAEFWRKATPVVRVCFALGGVAGVVGSEWFVRSQVEATGRGVTFPVIFLFFGLVAGWLIGVVLQGILDLIMGRVPRTKDKGS
jgi:hypothetical protein